VALLLLSSGKWSAKPLSLISTAGTLNNPRGIKMGITAKRAKIVSTGRTIKLKSKRESIARPMGSPAKSQISPAVTAKKTPRPGARKKAFGLSPQETALRNRIDRILLTQADDKMYNRVLEVLLETMKSEFGVFGYVDEYGTFVAPSMTRNVWEECRMPDKTFVFPRETWRKETLWGKALLEKKSLFLNGPGKVPEGHMPIHRALMVPILYRGDLIGIFQFANKKTDYSEEDVHRIENIAGYISPVLQARLRRDFEERRRKHVEEKLKRSEKRLRLSLEGARQGTWDWDLETDALTWDKRSKEIFGLSMRTPVSNEWLFQVLHPDDRQRVLEARTTSLDGKSEFNEEYRIFRPDGTMRWILSRARGFYDDSGKPYRMAGTLMDITERKHMEEVLRQRTLDLQQLAETLEQRVRERTSELEKANEMLQAEFTERLRLVAAVEQATEGLVIMDRAGLISYVNPAFERMNRSKPELLGKTYGQVISGEVIDEPLEKEIQDAIRGGKGWSGRVNRKRKDGPPLELDVTLSSIRDRTGKTINYLAVERDVTQEVRLQQHVRQMQKMEALGTLAGGIAHDFNNILNPILINTEQALLDAPMGSPVHQSLQPVLRAAERGRDLVKQIITFSRRKEQERKPVQTEPLIEETLKFLRSSLPSTVEIRENIQRETGYVLADPTQIHQVVMNLCSNAAYAMRENGGILEVGLAEVDIDPEMALWNPDLKPGPYLRLTVSDTGVGMTREVMERAFDPFFTTKKPGEGSGMGLSVVHGIVKICNGAITLYSELGKGTTFNVFFPRVDAQASVLAASPRPVVSGRERILLVDDEEPQIQSIQSVLERLGYTVVGKTDGLEAVGLFRENPQAFDLVITDQTMPQVTGIKLAEELLRIRPDVPVILCTGFSEMVDANGAKAFGIREFLMKPFSIWELGETIRKALEKK
jgi:PAS domain S-box-containing protein